jgi:hypothetical protein
MRPMLVNTKQKVAVLAAGLVVATTGLVTDQASAADPPAPVSAAHGRARPAAAGNEHADELAASLGLPAPVVREALREVFGDTSREPGGTR